MSPMYTPSSREADRNARKIFPGKNLQGPAAEGSEQVTFLSSAPEFDVVGKNIDRGLY